MLDIGVTACKSQSIPRLNQCFEKKITSLRMHRSALKAHKSINVISFDRRNFDLDFDKNLLRSDELISKAMVGTDHMHRELFLEYFSFLLCFWYANPSFILRIFSERQNLLLCQFLLCSKT